MDLPKLQFSALIDGVNAKKDKTLSIKLGTQEMSAEDASYILSLMGNQIYVAMAETAISEIKVPEFIPDIIGEKTPSQKLKSVIYVYWRDKTDQKTPFPRFYEDYIFKICENMKEKL